MNENTVTASIPVDPEQPEGGGSRVLSRRLLSAVVALLVLGIGAAVAFARGGGSEGRLGDGVVVIDTNLGYQGGAAAGTGMVLSSSGEVLTNNHVIKGATTIRIAVPGTGRSYPAKVVGYDVAEDVALLQAQRASNLKTVSIGDTSNLAPGQAVTALGNAGGTGSLITATGTITGLGKTITASDSGSDGEQLSGLIETDAGVQPGDSGGPLLNEAGQVIGMDTAASTGSPLASETANDAYAIPIDKAVGIAKQIESGEGSSTVHVGGTAFLGIEVGSGGSSDGYYGYGQSSSEAAIASVVPNAPADSAGLEAGDVITAINGQAISSASDVSSIMLGQQPGETVTVDYTDAYGTNQTAAVTLGEGPAL